MNELTQRLRDSNPYRDGALPSGAEATLQSILSSTEPKIEPTTTRPAHRKRRSPLVLAGAFLLVLGVAFSTTTWVKHDGAMAVTPQPLTITPSSLSIAALKSQLKASQPEVGGTASQLGSSHEGWSFRFDESSPTSRYIQARITSLEVAPDGSAETKIYAGAPRDEKGMPLAFTPWGAAEQGTLLLDRPLETSEVLGHFSAVPPETPEETRAYLDPYLNPEGATFSGNSAPDQVMASLAVLELWTLSSDAEKSFISVILDSDGIRVLGETRDRLGRDGIVLGLSPDPSKEVAERIIIDPKSWRILSSETINISGEPNYHLAPGAVIGYTLWDKQRQ